jgi:oleandomycin transport system ATP-binding protein
MRGDAVTYAIQAEGLVKRFGSTTALAGVDLAVPAGTVLGVLGPNGAGKTTAVRVLATLLRPDAGRATVGGLDVAREAAAVRRLVGLTGQYAAVDDDLTGTENLVLIGRLLDLRASEAKARARELLAEFDLTEAAGRMAKTYSGGMRRRLDLAASLVGRPSVIFLDEPTTGLDPTKRDEVWSTVRRLVSEGATVLLTTQYLDEADALADEISVFDRGRIIAHGTPHELKNIVGDQSLEVRPVDPARLDDVARVLAEVTGAVAESPRRGVLRVPVTGDAALTEAVARLAANGIAVTELALKLPGLDEVFAALTGKSVPVEEEAA